MYVKVHKISDNIKKLDIQKLVYYMKFEQTGLTIEGQFNPKEYAYEALKKQVEISGADINSSEIQEAISQFLVAVEQAPILSFTLTDSEDSSIVLATFTLDEARPDYFILKRQGQLKPFWVCRLLLQKLAFILLIFLLKIVNIL